MSWNNVLKFLPYVVGIVLLILVLLFYRNWQNQVKQNGTLTNQITVLRQMNDGLNKEITTCNKKITETAGTAAVSYGQCQDILKSNSTIAFDRGVAFGRATCGK